MIDQLTQGADMIMLAGMALGFLFYAGGTT